MGEGAGERSEGRCAMTDSEWEERQKARQEEIQACSEALAILTSDDLSNKK